MKASSTLFKDFSAIAIFTLVVGLSIVLYYLRFALNLSDSAKLFLDRVQVLSIIPCLIVGIRTLIRGNLILRRVMGGMLILEAIYIVELIMKENMP